MRSRSPWLWGTALFAYAFLYVPLLIVVIYSFNDSRLNAEWVGFTLDWYRKLAADDDMLAAAGNSLLIAVTASIVSTVLGTMAGVAMQRYKLTVLPVLVHASQRVQLRSAFRQGPSRTIPRMVRIPCPTAPELR